MQGQICINKQPIRIKEFNGQRVVTFKEIDAVHGRPDGTARRNFNDNRKHFILGEDYFVRNSYEARKDYGITAPNGLTLIMESGYLMLVKSFGDQLAWDVQRQLVDFYFERKAPVATKGVDKMIEQKLKSAIKMYHNRLVSTIWGIYYTIGLKPYMCAYYLANDNQFKRGEDYIIISGKELAAFKKRDPSISPFASKLTLIFSTGISKLCQINERFRTLPGQEKAIKIQSEERRKESVCEIHRLIQALDVLADELEFWDDNEEYLYPIRNAGSIIAFHLYSEWNRTGAIMKYKPA